MKNQIVLLLAASFIVLIQSCSIEKRIYQKGYHITRKTNSVTTQQLSNTNIEVSTYENKASHVYYKNDSDTIFKADADSNHLRELLICERTHTTNENNDLSRQIEKRIRQHKKDENINQTIHKAATIVKRLPTKNNSFDNTTKSKIPSVGLGLFLLGIGVMIAFGYSMPIGIIIGGLSILLILAIIITKALSPSGYIDVIYFKNGNIIRGQIIEQVPNVSLKIKTSDGSIYVHKFEEIEKITSEEL
jgi:hypothetical protein